MADSILRLKVDSQEYDAKIKRAAEGIQQYAQKCREVGGTLTELDDGVLEFVQALGKMDTVATSSKQQLREMSNSLTTLTQTYRGLTDEEKASPFGQELSKGIQQLTERAGEAQDAMGDVAASIKNAASDTRLFDQVAQGMSVATAGFQGLTGAGKLLGIEMGNDVEVIAKLQAAMAVTNSLTTIQTALQKESALMQGVMAARTALATAAQTALATATGSATVAQKAFNVVANANPYMLLATAIGTVVGALALFSGESREAKIAQSELDSAIKQTIRSIEELSTASSYIEGLATAAGRARQEILNMRAASAFNAEELAWQNKHRVDTDENSTEEQRAEAKRIYDEAVKRTNDANRAATSLLVSRRDALQNWDNAKTGREIQARISTLKDYLLDLVEGSDEYSRTLEKIRTLEARMPKSNLNRGGGSRPSSHATAVKVEEVLPVGSIAALTKEMQTLQKEQSLVTDTESWKKLQEEINGVTYRIKLLKGEIQPETGSQRMQKYTEGVNASAADLAASITKGMTTEAGKSLVDAGAMTKTSWEDAAKAIASAGSALQGLKEPSIKVAAIVGQAVANIALGFSKQSLAAAGGGPWAWIAAIAGGLGTMVSTIAAIKSATKGYSTGGRIEGNSYSGDNLLMPLNSGGYASLNAGEIVLNRAQTNNLANALTPQPVSNGGGAPYLTGELIFLGANNHLGRTGQGEIVTTSMLRSYGLIG
jgi:hypothetical protein